MIRWDEAVDISVMRNAAVNNAELISAPYDAIFNVGGFDALAVVLNLLGGRSVYVPTLRSVLSKCIESEAAKDRAASRLSVDCIARKYGYSSRHLRKLLAGK